MNNMPATTCIKALLTELLKTADGRVLLSALLADALISAVEDSKDLNETRELVQFMLNGCNMKRLDYRPTDLTPYSACSGVNFSKSTNCLINPSLENGITSK